MGAVAVYECTAIHGTNKKGIIPRDNDGYYRDQIIGAFNMQNSSGMIYDYGAAKKFFDDNGPFMTLVKGGYLQGEHGHPVREPGMSDRDWIARVFRIEEKNVSCHYRKIQLVEGLIKDPRTGKSAVAVLADWCPAGPYAEAVERAMENKHQNFAHSVRSIANDNIVAGQYTKYLKHLITWDTVFLPGISSANKYDSPSLESAGTGSIITATMMDDLIEDIQNSKVSFEHAAVDFEELRRELFDAGMKKADLPPSMGW